MAPGWPMQEPKLRSQSESVSARPGPGVLGRGLHQRSGYLVSRHRRKVRPGVGRSSRPNEISSLTDSGDPLAPRRAPADLDLAAAVLAELLHHARLAR